MKRGKMKTGLCWVLLTMTTALQAATDAPSLLREVEAARAKGGGTITLADGLYTFDTPWKLGPEDKNLVFEAAPGAVPVISAGRRITGWTVGKDGWWRAHVPKGEKFLQFYVNGQRRQRPFLPRQGYYFVKDSAKDDARKVREAAYITPQHWPTGENPDMEFCVIKNWVMFRSKIWSYDAATGLLVMDVPPQKPWVMPDTRSYYRFDNVRSALGEPGDWYLDPAAGEITYVPHPGEMPARCETVASRFDKAVAIEGSENVVFRGVVFSHGAGWALDFNDFKCHQAASYNPGTVQVEAAKGVRFEDCAFLHTGSYGLVMTKGSTDCAAERCEFSDLGAGGVRIGDGPDYRASDGMTANCAVRNCLIEKGGRFEPAGVGVLICRARDNVVANNTIEDLYYSGMSIGWSWTFEDTAPGNIIENNDINNIGQRVLSDMGGIYTLGLQTGTVIRGNRIRNVCGGRYGAFGMYQDSGSSRITISNNLVAACTDSSLFQAKQSADNRIENNIFLDAKLRQVYIWTVAIPGRPTTRLTGNIVKWTNEFFASLPGPTSVVSENNAYVCEDAGLPTQKDVRGFTRCRDLEEAKRLIGFKPFPKDAWGWKRARRFTANMPEVPAVFFPMPPRPESKAFREDFSQAKVGDHWPNFINCYEDKPETIRVVEEPSASSGRCIEFTQSLHGFTPHVYRNLVCNSEGKMRISFRIKLEKGASTRFEVRDGVYHADIHGPIVSFVGGGKLRGRDITLMDLPADVWIRVGMEFEIGETVTDHTYSVRVKLPGDEKPRVFDNIPLSHHFASVGWIGFMSDAYGGQKFRVDDFRFEP